MQTTFKDRLLAFLDHLEIGQTKFEELAGIGRASISKIKDGMSSTNLAKISTAFPELNTEWLITGKGKMLKEGILDNNADIISLTNMSTPKPFIDSLYASCGVPNGFSVAIKASDCENISIPLISVDYDFSIRAKGDSMINYDNPNRSIRDKDIVLCKLWKSRSHVRWGEVYALATSEGVVIKKIKPCEEDGSKIVCESYNEKEFPSYTLPLDEIYEWATVEGVFSINKW